MIKATLELTLKYPYLISLFHLFDIISLYGGTLVSGSTLSSKIIIMLEVKVFKILFKTNPKKGTYRVPGNMKHFLENIEIKEIITNE